ncbi:DUF937 domain-containing protein [candidate division KSB1 bacterium]|nr:DUF937 domain-containing protein [candidate division KSB1 bacterium]
MSNFVDDFMKSVGPEAVNQMSKVLGINKNTAAQIIPQVAPLILSGLKKQSEEHGGQDRVDHILNKYGSSSVLEDVAGLIKQKANDTNPDPKLGGLLGDSGVKAANMIASQFKLDTSTAMKLIPMLAPLILGSLTKKRDTAGAGSSGIASILDQDGDGSILDDVAGFLLGSKTGTSSKAGSNILGSLLGGLFGRRK